MRWNGLGWGVVPKIIEKERKTMSQHDQLDAEAIREMWWEQGEAVMREMCEEDDDE